MLKRYIQKIISESFNQNIWKHNLWNDFKIYTCKFLYKDLNFISIEIPSHSPLIKPLEKTE